jgi:oligopeptide/dipeptide ABC transporter ATP-binding protein
MANKSLEVKNLKISFRTNNGKVQAVRDISFDLERGRTLAIVGESGSGKSVTSRAIMGILAGNAIVEGGEIVFDGKDLLKIDEEEMYKIRGDKVAMIFQDPLSSLNPIMRIGKQITEAMLLKNKASRRESKRDFNAMLKLLQKNMTAADPSNASAVQQQIATLDKFCIQANKLRIGYNQSASTAENLVDSIEDLLFSLSKNLKVDVKGNLSEYRKKLRKVNDPFFVKKYADRLAAAKVSLNKLPRKFNKKNQEQINLVESTLHQLSDLLKEMYSQPTPDFFPIGFYAMKNPGEDLSKRDMTELNALCEKYLDDNFMRDYMLAQTKGLKHSAALSLEKKKAVLSKLTEAKKYFQGELKQKEALAYAKTLADQVEDSIDRMEIAKDNLAYTFRTGLVDSINKYFAAVQNNPKEEARFEAQSKKRDALIAKGKTIDWKVLPKIVYDLDEMKAVILRVVTRMESHYTNVIANASKVDFNKRSDDIISYLKDKASKVVYKITPAMAKETAIKLMEEVGIAEPRMRFNQYPFEFSGGMRQRIVIAIALSADPEVLICDEPTTALDVTIQAQILELINNLKRERNLSVIFITHDLGVVANMADDIAVMYAGKIVEYGTAEDVFYDPRHPYTWALLSAMPDLDTKEKLDSIPGTPPDMLYPPVGDAFAARNKYAMQIDFEQQPPMFQVSETHKAATWLLHPDAPKVEMPKAITDRIARMKKAGGAQ